MKSVPNRLVNVVALLMTLTAVRGSAQAQDVHAAAEAGDFAQVAEILASQPDLVSARNGQGLTPLHLAARRGHLDVIELLLENGAGLEETDARGFTPLLYAAASGNLDLVHFLVDRGAAVDVVAPMPRVREAEGRTNRVTTADEARGIFELNSPRYLGCVTHPVRDSAYSPAARSVSRRMPQRVATIC